MNEQVSDVSQREQMHLTDTRLSLPALPEKIYTGKQIVALMLAVIWLAIGENPDAAGGLLGDWRDLPLYALLEPAA